MRVCTCIHLILLNFKNSSTKLSYWYNTVCSSVDYVYPSALACVVHQKKFLLPLKGSTGGVRKVLGTDCNLCSPTSWGPRPFPNCSMSHSPRYPKRRWYVSAARGPSSGLNSMRIGPWPVLAKFAKRRRLLTPLLVHSRSWDWLGQSLRKMESRFPNNVCGHLRNDDDKSIVLAFRVDARSLHHAPVYPQ